MYGDALGERKGRGAFGQLLEDAHLGYEPESGTGHAPTEVKLEPKVPGAELKDGEWE